MKRKTKILWFRFFESLNIFNVRKSFLKLDRFDELTKFRLVNAFWVSFGMSILAPVLTVLQGTLMLVYVIGIFKIISMISVKTNEIIVESFNLDQLFKIIIFLHFSYLVITAIYFLSPTVMIYLDSFIGLVEIVFIGAFSIELTNYISSNFPETMNEFQIVRNSTWADGALLGLILSSTLLYLFPMYITILVFLLVNGIFTIWLFKNRNFYKKFVE